MNNIRFIASNYNPALPYRTNNDLQQTVGRWVSNMSVWESYIINKQVNNDYDYLLTDAANISLPVKQIKGGDISSIVKNVVGKIEEGFQSFPKTITVRATSPNILNRKMRRLAARKMQIDFPDLFKDLAGSGVGFDPMKGVDISTLPNAEKLEENIQEALEIIMTKCAKNFLYFNRYKEVFKKWAEDAVILGFCRGRIYVENGKIFVRRVPPKYSIYDNSIDDDHNRRARFAGELGYYSVPEVLAKWGNQLSEEEKKEITEMARNNSHGMNTSLTPGNWGLYNRGYQGFSWWGLNNGNVPIICVVEGQWLSYDEEGEVATTREGVLIGNKWCVSYGKSTNIVESKYNISDTELHYVSFIPDMRDGVNVGMVERVYTIQDRIDALNTRKMYVISQAKGKVMVIDSSKLPVGMEVKDVLLDLSQMGLTVTNKSDADDVDARIERSKFAEVYDMTIDYLGLRALNEETEILKRDLDNQTSVPAVSRGVQTSIIGKAVQEQTIQQSTYGLYSLLNGFNIFLKNICERGVDVAKIVMGSDESFESEMQVGDAYVELIKIPDVKEMKYSSFNLYMDITDAVDSAEMQNIMMIAQAAAQNGQIDMLDLLQIQKLTTKTEIINYLESAIRKKQAREDMIRQEQAAAEQKRAETNAQTVLQQSQINNQGATQRTQMTNEKDLQETEYTEQSKQLLKDKEMMVAAMKGGKGDS